VDYPMGVRQSATILFAEDLGRRSEKKIKERENGGGNKRSSLLHLLEGSLVFVFV
jgi:hypothetical protein